MSIVLFYRISLFLLFPTSSNVCNYMRQGITIWCVTQLLNSLFCGTNTPYILFIYWLEFTIDFSSYHYNFPIPNTFLY